MNKKFLNTAAMLGALSVAMGAFAAHKLRDLLPADGVSVFETGVRYQFYHTFALFLAGILSEKFDNKWLRISGNLFITGILLFCGSLYALTVFRITEVTGLNLYVGILTPFGGLFFILGWLAMLLGISKKTDETDGPAS